MSLLQAILTCVSSVRYNFISYSVILVWNSLSEQVEFAHPSMLFDYRLLYVF